MKNKKNVFFDICFDHPDVINRGLLENIDKFRSHDIYKEIVEEFGDIKQFKNFDVELDCKEKRENSGVSEPIILVEFLTSGTVTAFVNAVTILSVGGIIVKKMKRLLKKHPKTLEIGFKTAELIANLEAVKRKAIIGDPNVSFRRHCGNINEKGFKTEYFFIINGDYPRINIYFDSVFISVGSDGEVKKFYKFC